MRPTGNPQASPQRLIARARGDTGIEDPPAGADRRATAQLAASRIRLIEAADAERRRIERDLHDGVQQHLVALRIRLDLAAETIREDPRHGEQMIAAIGRQMDDLLETLRCLARGIYPSVLSEYGVGEALKSAARRAPLPISVRASTAGRYPAEIEVAVYFCCVEAIQNMTKHAGEQATGSIRLWRQPRRLCFEVRDTGAGFDPEDTKHRNGLNNMHDRIDAIGGTLTITSRIGHGTTVRGTVPAS